MSELLDPADVAARSLRVIPERFRKELETPVAERPVGGEREGLPPTYRMRADAHYVDQLIAPGPDIAIRLVPTGDIDGAETVDPSAVESLAASIKAHGVLQPLLVRRDEGRYRVIAGRRRLAAAGLAGLNSVPCIVHQVDVRAAEDLARAENVRGDAAAAPPAPAITAADRRELLSHLAAEVEGILSAASLFGSQPLPTPKRVSLDLIRSHAARAAWLLHAASLVDGAEGGERRLCLLGPTLERARDLLQPELRLSGISLELSVPDWNASAMVSEHAVLTAITGAVIATAAFVDQHPDAAITAMIVSSPEEPVSIDVAQETAAVAPEVAARFFDAAFTARPGGWPALVGALAVRAVARQHGGDASFSTRTGRGSILRMTIGRGR